jgi:outer membrane lipoprotein carrier protein
MGVRQGIDRNGGDTGILRSGLAPLFFLFLVFQQVLGMGIAARGQGVSRPDAATLRQVDDHYNHLVSLRARFVERYTGMGMNRSESGTLLLRKPGRMAWHYDTPAGKVFLFDGSFAWFYTPGDPQAQRIPAKQMDDLRTPLRFLLGHTRLEKELVHVTVSADGDQTRITGIPKGMEERVKQLSLRVTAAGVITEMRLEEVDGAVTEFSFSDIRENVPAAKEDFTFKPPAGVTVVNGSNPI